jgi:hypothetical protein
VPLTEEQRVGIEERLNELQGMKPLSVAETALALEAVRQVVALLGYDMCWTDGTWRLAERWCARCGEPLGADWIEAPWSRTEGPDLTLVEHNDAVCQGCAREIVAQYLEERTA